MSYLSYTKDFNDNLLLLLLRDHKRYLPIVEFFDHVTRGLSELSWAEAERIASEVSKANHSKFCDGLRAGMSGSLNADVSALKGEKLAAVLDFALKLNADAISITQKDIQAMTDAGWSEQTVEDVVGLVAAQRLYNIIATGLGFGALPAAVFAEISRDTVASGGYAASFRTAIAQTDEAAPAI